jgi:hypothetical protein
MTSSSPADSLRGRRLLVAVAVASGAAGVTAGMTFAGRSPTAGNLAPPIELAHASAGPIADQRDARAPVSASRAEPAIAVGPRWTADPSMPAAADALKGARTASGEASPTF